MEIWKTVKQRPKNITCEKEILLRIPHQDLLLEPINLLTLWAVNLPPLRKLGLTRFIRQLGVGVGSAEQDRPSLCSLAKTGLIFCLIVKTWCTDIISLLSCWAKMTMDMTIFTSDWVRGFDAAIASPAFSSWSLKWSCFWPQQGPITQPRRESFVIQKLTYFYCTYIFYCIDRNR